MLSAPSEDQDPIRSKKLVPGSYSTNLLCVLMARALQVEENFLGIHRTKSLTARLLRVQPLRGTSSRKFLLLEAAMALRFIGIDPDTGDANCPSVWVDERDGSIVIQGWEVTDPEERAQIAARSPIADNERIIRIPDRMKHILKEACSDPRPDDVR
ncbi:hypothetical protein ABT340_15650 [Streptosporangium sp. NPDC000239]|uniref:hypothetical protein n=1 Tax=Streptosporangium sp. NPDC000239 TaxID=3154248 RepID=UPI0033327FA4